MIDREPSQPSEFFSDWQNAVMDQPEEKILPDSVHTYDLLQQEHKTAEAGLLAKIDSLTRIPNRRALDDEIALVHEEGLAQAGVLFIDVNDFRRFNKKFTHGVGDHVLHLVAQAIGVNINADDIEFRYGGEEFLVLLKTLHLKSRWIGLEQDYRIYLTNPMEKTR